MGDRWESFFGKEGCTMGCIFGTGGGSVGVLWEAVLVLRVRTVDGIFGTGGGSVGVLWEAVFGTEGVYYGWHF